MEYSDIVRPIDPSRVESMNGHIEILCKEDAVASWHLETKDAYKSEYHMSDSIDRYDTRSLE